MRKIDETRPYGKVVGIANHVYEQDGKNFDAAGNEIGGETPAIITKDIKPKTTALSDYIEPEINTETIIKPKKGPGRPPGRSFKNEY